METATWGGDPAGARAPAWVLDVRYASRGGAPNSPAAAWAAVRATGVRRVLLEATYLPAGPEDNGDDGDSGDPAASVNGDTRIRFLPPWVPAYRSLATGAVSWEEWYGRYVVGRGWPGPGTLDELLAGPGTTQVWLLFGSGQGAGGAEAALAHLRAQGLPPHRVVVVTPEPRGAGPPGIGCAAPGSGADLTWVDPPPGPGARRLLPRARWRRPGGSGGWARSFSLRPDADVRYRAWPVG